MNKLANLYNQKGAGPKNIAFNFINEAIDSRLSFLILIPDISDYSHYQNTDNVRFIRLFCPRSTLLKVLFRVYLELCFIPFLVWRNKIKHLLAFGNFLFSPVCATKTVLLHHPYLVDDRLYEQLELSSKITEWLKRVAFYITTKNADHIVVQSDYMARQLERKYPKPRFDVEIIPNPISYSFAHPHDPADLIERRQAAVKNDLKLLYVSRFYPHKNHVFLVNLSRELAQRGIKHSIFVTVNPEIGEAKSFLEAINDSDVSIHNLTEVSQTELVEYYLSAHAFIFPSKAETFGNPLIEAMCYGLPVVVPDLEYAHAINGKAGLYYLPDDVVGCANLIIGTLFDESTYRQYSALSVSRFERFKTPDKWFQHYLTVMHESD
ncbi:hypothetical protein GCM10007891_01370 [Methylophaga thalassica]|uniref:Uncharacterized protein n=1 Tax=Methylophaga thalassica TaxID=40223 RepID=A0ABQ5TSW4_9GAMM|nr:glycosyltransferase [Methylophaga thalassica]GLP98283.1 hypothetical protein GCM10007891_01370 [Methylophaga thalassica]